MHCLPSGHVAIDVLDFGAEGFRCPEQAAVDGYGDDDFRLTFCPSNSQGVMFTTPNTQCAFQVCNRSNDWPRNISTWLQPAPRRCADGAGCGTKATAKSEGCSSKLASVAGQGLHGAKPSWLGGVGAIVAAVGDRWGSAAFPHILRAARRVHPSRRRDDPFAHEDQASHGARDV